MKSSQSSFSSYSNAYQNAKTNYESTQRRSEVGISSKESVLTIEQAYIAQGQNFAEAKQKMLTANIVLIQALGGAYWQDPSQTH